MIWTQVVFALIIGLIVVSLQNVRAQESVTLMKGNNSTRPGNKTIYEAPPLADNFLYTYYACRDKQNGLRLPVAGSCVDYYECQQGVAKRLTCKPGMHFSNLGLACLDARLSKCKSEQLAVNCEGLCCGREDGLYPTKDSCSDFLICVNGQSFRRSCGRMLHFSVDNRVCDIPERSRCSAVIDKDIVDEKVNEADTQVGLSKPTMYMVSHRVCQHYPNGYYAPIFGSCNKFYLCINGVGYLKSCGNLQFNAEAHYCDSRTRMYCPETEEDDVILDIEYAVVDTLPMPLPRPRPQGPQVRPQKPLPLDLDEDEENFQWGKRPIPSEEELDESETGLYVPPHRRPQIGKKPIPEEEEKVNKRPHSGKKPGPVVVEVEEEEEPENWPIWGKKPAQRPPNPEDKHVRPNKKPQGPLEPIPPQQGGNKQPQPKPPHTQPEPPHVELPEEEQEVEEHVVLANSNICSDEPVGALMAMPGDCSKYIRCRWDWYQRRVAEVLTCPLDMHFNAKSKYCDLPENAGCMAKSKKEKDFNKKNKFSKVF